jgi:hypothetical protein
LRLAVVFRIKIIEMFKMNNKRIELVGIITFICIVSMACNSKTLEDCLLDAAKISTQSGIILAESACHSKYRKPLTDAEQILNNSVKCDTHKLENYAKYIVANEKDKGKPDFEKVAKEYVEIREVCKALNIN